MKKKKYFYLENTGNSFILYKRKRKNISKKEVYMYPSSFRKIFFPASILTVMFLFSPLLTAKSPAVKAGNNKKQKGMKISAGKTAGKKVSSDPAKQYCSFCKDCPQCIRRREQLLHEAKEAQKAALLPKTEIDRLLVKKWEENSLSIPENVSDMTFLRRIKLNVTGKIPTEREILDFTRSKDKDKRKKLIDALLDSEEYAGMMTMRFADMLRIKSEFPINLWPNAVQAYHRKIYGDILKDRSYREIAQDMLTNSGSNFRIPYANFFRASANRSMEGLAKVTALTFLGIRTEKMKEEDLKKFSAFFSRIRYKSTDEWKEEIVYTDPLPCLVKGRTPDGKTFTISSPQEDPREVFAAWLLHEDNPYFARAFVNRLWHYYFGKGLIHPADDMPVVPISKFKRFFGKEEENCVNTDLLEYLASEFKKSNYSIKHVSRLILNSKAYQAPPGTGKKEDYAKALKYFAVYPLRRMEAEVIVDMLASTVWMRERYMSVIPEPFTYIPLGRPTILIDDGSLTSGLLDKFGRPSRDSGELAERKNIATDAQRLYLLNSSRLYNATRNYGRNIARWTRGNPAQGIRSIYLKLLSRYPQKGELDQLLKKLPAKKHRSFFNTYQNLCQDLAWALVNTKEFLYYH